MNELNFQPMDDREISDYRMLSEIVDELKKVTGVTIIGISQYANSTDGEISNKQILVGASYVNAQTRDLATLLKLSPSCAYIDSTDWFSVTEAKNTQKMWELASRARNLEIPNFRNFLTIDLQDERVFYAGWLNVINSIINPNVNRSVGQSNAYQKLTTGMYRHTEYLDRYYVRGFELSSQILAEAINPRRDSTNEMILVQNAIKYKLNLMMTKYRNLHLRESDTRIRIRGNEISIAMTAEKIREVRATNQAKKVKREAKEAKKRAKETATKE